MSRGGIPETNFNVRQLVYKALISQTRVMQPKVKNAVLVGIQLPKVSQQEFDGSLEELARLVKTLGYNVVGQVTQKRNSDRSSILLGTGKLAELAAWTNGSGEVASMVDRKLTKAICRQNAPTFVSFLMKVTR